MAEYIKREALIAEFKRLGLGENGLLERVFAEGVYTVIEAIPAADVSPMEHGKWVSMYRSGVKVERGYVSTCCDMWAERSSPYCPNCGARMDGGA